MAIAISLVPPLAVVGLTLESGAGEQAAGALLLFVTNVAAILLSGLVVMAIYRVTTTATDAAGSSGSRRHGAIPVVVTFVLVLAIPLTISSRRITTEARDRVGAEAAATGWATAAGWRVLTVDSDLGGIHVRASGAPPGPRPSALRRAFDEHGLKGVDVTVELVPETRIELPGS